MMKTIKSTACLLLGSTISFGGCSQTNPAKQIQLITIECTKRRMTTWACMINYRWPMIISLFPILLIAYSLTVSVSGLFVVDTRNQPLYALLSLIVFTAI